MVSACVLGHLENARALRISPDSILQLVAGCSVSGQQAWKIGTKTYAQWQDDQILQQSATPDCLPDQLLFNDNGSFKLEFPTVKKQREIIIDVGAEGGSLTIFGSGSHRRAG